MSETDSERAALLASARAYLEWEREVSGCGIPASVSATQGARSAGSAQAGSAQAGSAQAGSAQKSEPPGSEAAAAASPAPEAPKVFAGASFSEPSTPPEQEPRTTLVALGDASAGANASSIVGDKRARLAVLEREVRVCTRCELAKGRTQTVFARGNPDSPLVFIGEGPGQEEDREGLPFVGPAGKLLDRMVAAMGFARDDVYICNVVKCRPPGNRTPLPSEAGACAPFLLGQLEAVKPKVIVALGRCAAENLGLVGGGGWRGRWGKFRGFDVMPTYHPAYLLRSPEFKRPVWEDLQKVMSRLEQPS